MKKKKVIRVIWLIIVIIGVLSMVFFTVLPALSVNTGF